MKNLYIVVVLFIATLSMNTQAQDILVTDDMEWDAGNCPSHWSVWAGGPGCPMVGPGGYTGAQSGYIPGDGTTDIVLNFGNKIFGEWTQNFWMYVPLGKEAYFNLQGAVPVGDGQWIVGNIYFNQDLGTPGEGFIDNSALGLVTFNFPHDEWFQIEMYFDITLGISLATWQMYVDGENVIPAGTAFTNFNGDVPTSLGGMNFFSISADNEYYIDDFGLESLGVSDFSSVSFEVFPNPASDRVNISSEENIVEIKLYSIDGKLVEAFPFSDQINVSHLNSGIYFIEVRTSESKGVQKLIKK